MTALERVAPSLVDALKTIEATDRAVLGELDVDLVVAAATFVGVAEDHLRPVRLQIGLWLTIRRDLLPRGEWGPFVAEFAASCGRSERSVREWMRVAQDQMGLDPPAGANVDRRSSHVGKPETTHVGKPIETTARETSPATPAAPAVKKRPAAMQQLELPFLEEAERLQAAPVADLAALGKPTLKALQSRVAEALRQLR